MSKKIICGQVNIPETNNTSPCKDFNYSQCIIVDRLSKYVKNVEGANLNQYHELLENKIKIMELKIKTLENIIKHIASTLPEIGIGIYEQEDGE